MFSVGIVLCVPSVKHSTAIPPAIPVEAENGLGLVNEPIKVGCFLVISTGLFAVGSLPFGTPGFSSKQGTNGGISITLF